MEKAQFEMTVVADVLRRTGTPPDYMDLSISFGTGRVLP